MKRNLVTAFGAIAGSQVAILLVSIFFQPLLIRLLGVSTYGVYATLTAVFDLLMVLVSAGINGGARKFISEEHEDDEWESYVFAYYFRLAFVFALIGSLILIAAVKFGLVKRFFKPSYATYFFLMALLIIAAQFRAYSRRTLMGLKLEHLGEPLNVLFKISFVVVALGFALLGFGVAGIFVAQIVASMLVFVIAFVLVSRKVSLKKIFSRIPDYYPKKKMFYFNYETIVYIFLLTSMYKIDLIMLGIFSSSAQSGYYKAALVLAELLWFLPKSLQSLLIQSMSDHWEKGRTDVIENIATRAVRYVLLLTIIMGIGLAALAPVFVPLYYGANMTPAITPLLILIPGAIGFAFARPLLTINHSKGGDMKILIGTTGIAATLNLVLNYLLIPRYGMIGAAISTTIGYGSLPILQVYGSRRLGYRPFKGARLGRIAATAVLSGTVIGIMALVMGSTTLADIGLTVWLIGETPIAILIVPPAGVLLYSLIAIATGAIDLGEILEILVRIPGPVGSTARPIKQRFEASEQFGNEQSQSSAVKLIFSLAAVIVIVCGAVMATGFPLLAMTPLGTTNDGVFGPLIQQEPAPPTRTPLNNSTRPTPRGVVTPITHPTATTPSTPQPTQTPSTSTPVVTTPPTSTPTTSTPVTPDRNTTNSPTPTTPPTDSPTPITPPTNGTIPTTPPTDSPTPITPPTNETTPTTPPTDSPTPTTPPTPPTDSPTPPTPPTDSPTPTTPPTDSPTPTTPPTDSPTPTTPPTNETTPTTPPTDSPTPTTPPTNETTPTTPPPDDGGLFNLSRFERTG